ncbi:MAG: KaiC domain-containing protein [Haloferacaceae archaeon]
MSENDDWFERALRELEAEGGPSDDERRESPDDERRGEDRGPPATGATSGNATDEELNRTVDEFGFETFEEGAESKPDAPADEFGFADIGGTGRPETDPFGGAEGQGDGPDEEFGADFDDAELDSDVDRIKVGIEGLDRMVLGGVPKRSLIAVIGGAGTGKTTFALQFLQYGLDQGERGIYITLEESKDAILSTAEEKGWSFREFVDDDRLAVVAMDPIEMANGLSSIRSDLTRLVDDYDADRLVLDSVSLLEMMYDHPAKRRSQVFEFTRSLKEAGVTTLLTSEASDESPFTSRYGIVEYLTDAVFVLRYVRTSNFQETRLAVEIQKIRDANHSRETKPYEITNEGLSVYQQANIF